MNASTIRLLEASLACALLLATSPALAQTASSERWLVLAATVGELPEAGARLAESAEGAVADRQHALVTVNDLPDLGSDVQAFPVSLEARLTGAIQPALEDAAYGRRARVLERVTPLLAEASQYLDALGDQPVAATAVSDLALIAARVHADGRDEASARATVERLLSLVPTPEPNVDSHPHAVLALLSQARARLREGGGDAHLRVDSADPGGCNAYLNGQLVGPTPQSLALYAGNYAVRVQCGSARSRVHLLHLVENGEAALSISTSLEGALLLRPRMHLRYEDAGSLASRAQHDAGALAQQTGADHVALLLIQGDRARVEVLRMDGVTPRLERSAQLSLPPSAEDLQSAWAAVLDGRTSDATAPAGASAPSEWNIVIGAGFAALGVVALVSPIHTLARLGECVDSPAPGFCNTEIAFGAQSGVLLGLGVAAIAAGVVFWLTSPIQVSVAADDTSARLFLGGRF